jgi:hypothetical protein
MKLTLLADRSFADRKPFATLEEGQLDYVIRMRGNFTVESEAGERKPAKEWTPKNGHARLINAWITNDRTPVPAVVCIRRPG